MTGRVANLFCCLCLQHRRVRAALCVVFAGCANENWRNTMAFGLVFGLVSAARLDGKSGRQRASSAHPFENRKRMRHPLLRYRKQENQEAVKAAPPVDPEPSCNITANYAGEGFVHFVASDSYGCSRSSDSTQVDAYAIPTAETTSPSGETYD